MHAYTLRNFWESNYLRACALSGMHKGNFPTVESVINAAVALGLERLEKQPNLARQLLEETK